MSFKSSRKGGWHGTNAGYGLFSKKTGKRYHRSRGFFGHFNASYKKGHYIHDPFATADMKLGKR